MQTSLAENTLERFETLKEVSGFCTFPKIEDVKLFNRDYEVSLNKIDWFPVTVIYPSAFYLKKKKKFVHKLGMLRKILHPDFSVDEVYDEYCLTIDVYKLDSLKKYRSFCGHEEIIAMQEYNRYREYFCHPDSEFDYGKALIDSFNDIRNSDFKLLREKATHYEWQWEEELRWFSLYNRLFSNGCIEVSPFKYGLPNDWTDPDHTYGIKERDIG